MTDMFLEKKIDALRNSGELNQSALDKLCDIFLRLLSNIESVQTELIEHIEETTEPHKR